MIKKVVKAKWDDKWLKVSTTYYLFQFIPVWNKQVQYERYGELKTIIGDIVLRP